MPNGSILEEVRNGTGAYVSGANFEFNISPSAAFGFEAGGTVQQSVYREEQILFEPETPSELEPEVSVNQFVRSPNVYGYVSTNWAPSELFTANLTGAYTGSMIVPRVASESGFLDLVKTNPFMEVNLKLARHIHVAENFNLDLSAGVQNMFNSYQDDFDSGATRDSDYVYGPGRPRTFFLGLTIGNFH